MNGTGAPRPPGQEHPADAVEPAGASPSDPGEAEAPPPPSSSEVRAAKLTAANMARSLLPLLVICLAVVGWAALRQNPDDPVIEVDPSSSVRASAERASYELLVPTGLPDGYRPTSSRTTAGSADEGDPVTLEIGYFTPAEEFAGFVISDDESAAPVRQVLDDAQEQGSESIGGRTWTRETTSAGETAFVLETGEATVVVFGSAPDDELAEVAGSVRPYRG
jgi:hypothetical protein